MTMPILIIILLLVLQLEAAGTMATPARAVAGALASGWGKYC